MSSPLLLLVPTHISILISGLTGRNHSWLLLRPASVPWAGEAESQREENNVLLLKENILHQADRYFGGSFPSWMLRPGLPAALDPTGPYACDGSPLGCQACCPPSCPATCITATAMLRGCMSGERRRAGVPGFAMWLLMLSWLLATGVRERKTIRSCTAIKQPPNCSTTYGSSAAF